jgi:hypothetical protein
LREKVSVHWVRVTSTKRLATGKRRRYRGKRRFKMYITDGHDDLRTKYVGLGTFLRYNKRVLLLPFVGLALAFFTRGIWLPYATSALRLLFRLFRFDWPS